MRKNFLFGCFPSLVRLTIFHLMIFSIAAQEQGQKANADLAKIHNVLLDWQRLAQQNGFVFVGEVSRNEQIRQKRCAKGVEQLIAYRVLDVLWNYPNSLVSKGYTVSKGFVDCKQNALPELFKRGTKIITHCEAPGGMGYICDGPILYSGDRLEKVQGWLSALRSHHGSSVLLQIHYHLLKAPKQGQTKPRLLLGRVLSITATNIRMGQSVIVLPTMRLAVTEVLWGSYKNAEIEATCPNRSCSKVPIGSTAVAYCEEFGDTSREMPSTCRLSSTEPTEDDIKLLRGWVAEARQLQKENLRRPAN